MMRKKIFKLVFIFGLFLVININPMAYECYYKASSGEEIRLIRSDTNHLGIDKLFIDSNTMFNIFPLNSLIVYSDYFQPGGAMLYIGNNGYDIDACPKNIYIYYLKNEDKYLIDNKENLKIEAQPKGEIFKTFITLVAAPNEYNSLLVKYSDKGVSLEGNIDVDVSEDHKLIYCGGSCDNSLLKKIDNSGVFYTKTFTYNANKNTIKEADEDGYIECEYRNNKEEYLKFRLLKSNGSGYKEYVYVNGQEKEVSRINVSDQYQNLNSCPPSIAYPALGGDKYFAILDSCVSSDYGNEPETCYSEKSLPLETPDDITKTIKYISSKNSNYSINVNVLNGSRVVVERVNAEIEITNFNASDFISGNYPDYIIRKDQTFTIVEKLNDVEYDEVYILKSKLTELSQLPESDLKNTCEEIFGETFITFLQENIFKVIYIAVPIILLVLTTIDFAKVVFIDDKEGIKKAGSRFGKRLIVAVLIYLTPTILIFIVDIIGADEVNSCMKMVKNYSQSE